MSEVSFPEVDPGVVDGAVDRAVEALDADLTPRLLAAFYDPSTGFAGHTFASLGPVTSESVTATDLLALTTLNIDLSPYEIRRIVSHEENGRRLSGLLAGLPEAKLEDTTPEDFVRMEAFYDEVKRLLAPSRASNSNRWVATSKLVARKRPALFPVRDRVVCGYLGILGLKNRTRDWYVFRELMRHEGVRARLVELPSRINEAKEDRSVDLDTEPLRLLDAALWRYGKEVAGF